MIVEVKKIEVSFGRNKVLKNLNFEIEQNEVLGIAGVSGSGKTTLLNVLTGIVKPKHGSVEYIIDGKRYDLRKNYRILRHYIGYSFQAPCFYNELSVYENLDYFSSLYGISKALKKGIINRILKLVELDSIKNRRSGSLSGGMKRRLDIALALVHSPKIIFLDEPTSDLDPLLRERIWALIKKINQNGTTVVVSSHYLSELENFCNRVALLHNHKIMKILKNTAQEFLNEEWIQLTTRSRNYNKIIKELEKENHYIIAVVQKGDSLLVKTQHSEKVISTLLNILKHQNEEIESIERITPTIEEIFKDALKK